MIDILNEKIKEDGEVIFIDFEDSMTEFQEK